MVLCPEGVLTMFDEWYMNSLSFCVLCSFCTEKKFNAIIDFVVNRLCVIICLMMTVCYELHV